MVIQRNVLASKFNCVPSQINYVLATRFTAQSGFLVESRRGGGGFIRIVKLPAGRPGEFLRECYRRIESGVSAADARSIIGRMLSERIISAREANLMMAALDDAALNLEHPWRNRIRANILKAMIASLFSSRQREG